MRINCGVLAIVIIASIIFCYVTADSKELSKDAKNQDGNEAVDPAKKGKASELSADDSNVQLEVKGGESKQVKANDNDQRDKQSDTDLKKKSRKERVPPSREKCDSPSNSCMDDEDTLVACLRVPGNDSPAHSLLIQNKGKGSRNITISAPDLVKLQKNKIHELGENKDAEVTVWIKGLGSDPFIVLTAGHGDCRLNFTEQYLALKKVDPSSDSSHFSIFKLISPSSFLVLAVLLAAVASFFIYTKFGRKYFVTKGPKYQKLDAELPISHGSKLEAGVNEGWDDSWGDNWDDEEAPLTPSMPLTPSLSSKGIASRKFNKDAWND